MTYILNLLLIQGYLYCMILAAFGVAFLTFMGILLSINAGIIEREYAPKANNDIRSDVAMYIGATFYLLIFLLCFFLKRLRDQREEMTKRNFEHYLDEKEGSSKNVSRVQELSTHIGQSQTQKEFFLASIIDNEIICDDW